MDDAPFLHKDPPPAVARGLSTLIVALFLAALVVSATVRVSETVTAPFTLIPVRGTDPVRAPRKGSVTKASAIVGQPVTKGSLLYEINSPEFADRFSERETLDSTVIGVTQSLSNARARRASENRAAEEESRGLTARVASLDRTVALKKEQLTLMTEQLDRFRKLADQGLASTNER